MKIIRIDLPRELKEVEVHIFADLHIGDPHCDMKLINERIDYVKNNKQAYCILNGDLCDNATKDSIGDTHSEIFSPQKQVEKVTELFMPIKHKIIAINTGTHELRTHKRTGIDMTKYIADNLGIDDRYSATSSLVFLRFGTIRNNTRQRCFTIYSLHGVRSGRKVGGKALALSDMGKIVNADIIIHSHSHQPITFKENMFQVDSHNSSFYEKEMTYINTASMLDYGGYGAYGEYAPSSKTSPIILLHQDSKAVRVLI